MKTQLNRFKHWIETHFFGVVERDGCIGLTDTETGMLDTDAVSLLNKCDCWCVECINGVNVPVE